MLALRPYDADTGISLRCRRTGATVIARAVGTDSAAALLGHAWTVITEGNYIEPDPSVDPIPAAHLERTWRPADREGELLAAVDRGGDDGVVASHSGRAPTVLRLRKGSAGTARA